MYIELYNELISECEKQSVISENSGAIFMGTSLAPALLNIVKRTQSDMTSGLKPTYVCKKICDQCGVQVKKLIDGMYPTNCYNCGAIMALNRGQEFKLPTVACATDLDPINSELMDLYSPSKYDYLNNV